MLRKCYSTEPNPSPFHFANHPRRDPDPDRSTIRLRHLNPPSVPRRPLLIPAAMGSVDLVLKSACEGCGSTSDLYGTGCKHTTLCSSCGKSMALSRARCLVCSAPITNLIREYNVRANASTDKAFSIGRFVTGLPPFSKKKNAENKWSLHKEGLQGRQLTDKMLEKYNRKPWILEDETGQYQFQGHMEGSQSATATYYLLMLHGKEFHAFPAGSWYNFSKVAQYKQLTLEEAEEKMNKRKTSATGYERWMMKAATNGPAAFGSDMMKLEPANDGEKESARHKKGKDNEEGGNSDKGEENEEEEAGRKDRLGLSKRGMDDDEEGGKDLDFDLDDDIEKGDDWEHEETFTDDDEAVDIDPEERADLAPEIPAPPEIKQDDEENEEEGGLSKSGKELKKLLGRSSGQNESDADDDDDEDDQDDESSPVLAPKQTDQPKDEPVDNSPAKPTPSSGHARSTPPASKSKQKRKSGGDDAKASSGAASKKAKVESDTKTSSIKEETPSSSKPTPKASASSRSANVSPVTEGEIRTVLLAMAPVTTQDLVSRFKSRLRGPEEEAIAVNDLASRLGHSHKVHKSIVHRCMDAIRLPIHHLQDKNAFAEILKKISKIQKTNGHNYVVLREDKK
ncbi:transcription initiation factor IIF subunit alpha-like isoform X1 [Triticum dicoccoides]|uniref:transcription initiation factor IIF subunit alpha-like isoform X1 n=1 Tax=Triticum dicoccoides TaxID=85692 RepID=UPI001890443A|nr:transcription initiation factor IIF subunit alpha-like isoform X1 [Triticum dicoccoides]